VNNMVIRNTLAGEIKLRYIYDMVSWQDSIDSMRILETDEYYLTCHQLHQNQFSDHLDSE
jgi:hypothetical protein